MNKIDNLLIALPLREDQRTILEEKFPDTNIVYRDFMEPSEKEVAPADLIFGNVEPEYIKKATNLKWIQLATAGSDNYVDFVPQNVTLTNASGAYGGAISEHMLAFLLSLQKKLPLYYENQQKGRWKHMGKVKSIEDSVCLVVGLGDIGGSFAKKMKALGAYTIGLRRTDLRKPEYMDEIYTLEKLDELLPRADVVALSLPQSDETKGLMNRQRLASMKEGSILINVGRGSAIEQEALIDALNSGHLGGAAIDVAAPEPLPENDPLWKAKNLIITPHVSGGWSASTTIDKVFRIFMKNYESWQNNEPMQNLVDFESGYRRVTE